MKRNKKIIAFSSLIVAIMATISLFLFNHPSKTTKAYEVPADYAIDVSNISSLSSGQSYGGIDYYGTNSFTINGSTGLITLARISHSDSLEGYTFRILVASTAELGIVTNGANVVSGESFFGIGDDDHPFRGNILVSGNGSTYLEISDWPCIFNHISTIATIKTEVAGYYLISSSNKSLQLSTKLKAESDVFDISGYKQNSTSFSSADNAGFIAGTVHGSAAFSIDLTSVFSASQYSISSTGASSGGLFGTISPDSDVTVKLARLNCVSDASQDSGILVGTSYGKFTIADLDGGTLNLSGSAESANASAGIIGRGETVSVITSNAPISSSANIRGLNSGGFVGLSKGTISTSGFTADTISVISLSGGTAGGFAGKLDGAFVLDLNDETELLNHTISGYGSIGGFVGYYNSYGTGEVSVSNVYVNGLSMNASQSTCASGFIGQVVIGKSTDKLDIELEDKTYGFTFTDIRCVTGGIVGSLSESNIQCRVSISASSKASITNTFNVTTAYQVGGIIGLVNSETSYVEIDKLSLTNTFSLISDTAIADGVGKLKGKSIIVFGDIEYKRTDGNSVFIGETLDESIVCFEGDFKDLSTSRNNVVAKQTNSLIYADTGFSPVSPSTINGNDIGNYGQILRDDNINILSINSTTHVLEYSPLSYNTSTKEVNINSLADFAKLYIYYITSRKIVTLSSKPSSSYDEVIKLNTDINLQSSGIESLFNADSPYDFIGKLYGNNHSITMAFGENVSGYTGILNANDKRKYYGLFASIKNATIDKVVVNGTIELKTYYSSDHWIGGLAAKTENGDITITDCTSNIVFKAASNFSDKSYYIGGFIGQAKVNNIVMTGSTSNASITSALKSGRLAGFIGKIEISGSTVDFSSNKSSAKVASTSSMTDAAKTAGFIASLSSDNYITINMNKTTIDGCTISANTSNSVGGFIGYDFTNCEITLNAPIKDSSVTSSSSAKIGGLFYEYMGKLIIDSGSTTSFSFINSSIKSTYTSTMSAMIYKGLEAYVAIRLDRSIYDGLTCNDKDIENSTKMDLAIALSIDTNNKSKNISVGKTGGFATFETMSGYGTNAGTIPLSSTWLPLIEKHKNNSTRYYFNVEELENYEYSSNITSARDLMYFDVSTFIPSALKPYYFTRNVTSIVSNTNIDMTNRCFYPVNVGNVSVNFNGYQLKIDTTAFAYSVDYQFRGLGCGLLLNAEATGSNTTVSLNNIELAGTIRSYSGNGGALICDTVSGKKVNDETKYKVTLNISHIYFNNLKIKEATKSALMINSIDSYATINIDNVTHYTKSTYDKASKTNTYTETGIATSLIGKCGVDGEAPTSTTVSCQLSAIVLDAKTSSTIFTGSSLFKSIYYIAGTSSFIYNFNVEEDHKSGSYLNNATYGKEIVLNEEQHMYFDSETIYVSSTENQSSLDSTIQTNYLFYVASYDKSSQTATSSNFNIYLSVNRKTANLIEGFGTFENPYIITSPLQLAFVAAIIRDSNYNLSTNWKINYPISSTNYNSYYEYTYNGSTLSNTSGNTLSRTDLQSYLQGAYYYINGELEMKADFIGIGTTSYPFHGVIVGSGAARVIMPGNEAIYTDGMGLVNVANGCAIYNLEIVYKANLQIDATEYDATSVASSSWSSNTRTSSSPYFGGAIGFVCGGDNLIDSVTITYNGFSMKGSSNSVAGGYVGLVACGGVVLKNVGSGIASFNSETIPHIYYNPYIGKVKDGYAVSLGSQLENSSKNYNIIQIDDGAYGNIYASVASSKCTFQIANAKELLILSMAMNSGSLARNSGQVGYGLGSLSRVDILSDLSKVNNKTSGKVDSYGKHTTDVFTNASLTYLQSMFQNNTKLNTITSYTIEIYLTGSTYDMSAYKNGFRAISGVYVNSYKYKISKLEGIEAKSKINLDMNMKCYYNAIQEPDAIAFYGILGGVDEILVSKNLEIQGTIKYNVYTYAGYSAALKENKKSIFSSSSDSVTTSTVEYVSMGAICGRSYKCFNASNIYIHDFEISSPCMVGGLCGYIYSAYDTNLTLADNIEIKDSQISSLRFAGGITGLLGLKKNKQYIIQNITITNTDIITAVEGNAIGDSGIGGIAGRLVGRADSPTVLVRNFNMTDSLVLSLTTSNARGTYTLNAGGVIGLCNRPFTGENITIKGTGVGACGNIAGVSGKNCLEYNLTTSPYNKVQITELKTKANGVQGIVSYLTTIPGGTWCDGAAGGIIGEAKAKLVLTNCSFEDSENYTAFIFAGNNAGGMLGQHQGSGSISITGCSVKANYHGLYIFASTRAGGLMAYEKLLNGTTFTNVKAVGTATSRIYIYSSNYDKKEIMYASGILSGFENNASVIVDNAEVAFCNMTCYSASAVVGHGKGKAYLSNIYVHDNYLNSYAYFASAVKGMVEHETYMNNVVVCDNYIVSAKNYGAGILTRAVSDTLYANYVIVSGNKVGTRSTFIGFDKILNNDPLIYSTAIDESKSGYFASEKTGTIKLMAVSREEGETPLFSGPDIRTSSTPTSIAYVGYGALDIFKEKYGTENEVTAMEAINLVRFDSMTEDYFGDSMSDPTAFADEGYRENLLTTDKLSNVTSTISSQVSEGTLVSKNLPLLLIKGDSDESVREYIEHLLSESLGDIDAGTISISIGRVYIEDDGSFRVTSEKGSIVYENKMFKVGKYDNLLSEDSPSFTLLTITFTNKKSSTENTTYTMHIAIYYPQVLELETIIIPIDSENYQISAFLDRLENVSNPYHISISSKDNFSLYIQYRYNDVALTIEDYNFGKYLHSTDPDTKKDDGKSFPAGTSFLLIDINNDLPKGFKEYYYTIESASTTILYENFRDSDGNLFTGCQKNLNELDMNSESKYVENYILIVNFPKSSAVSEAATQYNLKANVMPNDMNIIVNESVSSKLARIDIWKEPTITIDTVTDKTTSDGTISLGENHIVEDIEASVSFPDLYIQSLSESTKMYGVYTFQIKNNVGTAIDIPNNAVIKIFNDEGTLLKSEELINKKTYSFSLGNIISAVKASGKDIFTSNLRVEIDFSGCDPLEYRNSFINGENYKFSASLYYSSSEKHYNIGTFGSDSSQYQAIVDDNIKLTVSPTDVKRLSININSTEKADSTNDGKITFKVKADFTSCIDNMPSNAMFTFEVYEKVYDAEKDKHLYDDSCDMLSPTKDGYVEIGKIYKDSTDVTSGCTATVTDGIAEITLLIDVYNKAKVNAANYKVMVFVRGLDEEGNPITDSKDNYFIFQICDIMAEESNE